MIYNSAELVATHVEEFYYRVYISCTINGYYHQCTGPLPSKWGSLYMSYILYLMLAGSIHHFLALCMYFVLQNKFVLFSAVISVL